MSTTNFVWHDLTVTNAESVRDFYSAVLGWTAKEHPMGEYSDYEMFDSGGKCVAGICHARGANAAIPAAWLPYCLVDNLGVALQTVAALGGTVVDGPRPMGESSFACVRDPAGAYIALMGPLTA